MKSVDAYSIVGKSVPRIDLPAKATGELVYVHDVRLPGMLHGRVVRPPYAGVDAGPFVGTSLIAVDEASVRHIPGLVAVVRIGDFVGVVAEREENAIKAAAQLKVSWKPVPTLPDLKDIETALRANPSVPRTLIDKGNVDAAIAGAAKPMQRTYVWPYQMHASIGPSCAVADCGDDHARVWSGTQNPHHLRTELARLIHRREAEIEVIRMEAAGCYGRNCADDVTADALLLSRAVGRPVRVQLTREQEHAWEPKGTAQLMDVNGGLNADGSVAATISPPAIPPTARRHWRCCSPARSRRSPPCSRWATAPRSRPTITTTCAWWRTTCRRSCARRGFAASRRCPTRSPMNPTSTNSPPRPASIRSNIVCAI